MHTLIKNREKKRTAKEDVVDTDRLSFTLVRRINRALALNASVNFAQALDLLSDDLIVSTRIYIEYQLLDEAEVRYPDDWWQALRERWLPQWALRRWPVRYSCVKMTAALYDERIGNLLKNRGYSARIIVTSLPDNKDNEK